MAHDAACHSTTSYGRKAQQLLATPSLNNLRNIVNYPGEVKSLVTDADPQFLGEQLYYHITTEHGVLTKPSEGPLAAAESEPQYIILLALILVTAIEKSANKQTTIEQMHTAFTTQYNFNADSLSLTDFFAPTHFYIILLVTHLFAGGSETFGTIPIVETLVKQLSIGGIYNFYQQLNAMSHDAQQNILNKLCIIKIFAFDYACYYHCGDIYTDAQWMRFFVNEHHIPNIRPCFPTRELLQPLIALITSNEKHYDEETGTWVMAPNVGSDDIDEQKNISPPEQSNSSSIISNLAAWLLNETSPEWARDSVRNYCIFCKKNMLLIKKHHCRTCGGHYCDTCAPLNNHKFYVSGTQIQIISNRFCLFCLPKNAMGNVSTALHTLQQTHAFNFSWLLWSFQPNADIAHFKDGWQEELNKLINLLKNV